MPLSRDYITWLIIISIVDGQPTVSYNQPKFCPHASWNPLGTTFADSWKVGSEPYGIFIDINNTIYVAAQSLNTVKVWSQGSTILTREVSCGTFCNPTSLFVTTTGDIYLSRSFTSVDVNKSPVNTANSAKIWSVDKLCTGLVVDLNNTLYCSMREANKVIKKSLNSGMSKTITAAGTGSKGKKPNELDQPYGIFVDTNFDLYVADCDNNRIQRFQSDQRNGTTVVGSEAIGTIELKCPTGIVLDADNYLFIVDGGNNRIVGSGPKGFRCLVGCSDGSGSESDQLSGPRTLSFDRSGNMYVTDRSNDRVQKFVLASNSCVLSYNQPQFCPTASWEHNAVTFANITTIGANLSGIFVSTINTIYVASQALNEIKVWTEGNATPSRIIFTDLFQPISLFVTITGDIYVNNGSRGQVYMWAVNTTSGITAMYIDSFCFGIFIDVNNSLYCSIGAQHKIVKRSLNSNLNTTTLVAGTGSSGKNRKKLNNPRGIFVDTNFDLYVADSKNNRIQRFRPGQKEGKTVVELVWIDGSQFNSPQGVVLDAAGYLFIVDSGNNRIIKSGPNGFHCVVGCDKKTSAPRQLNNPGTLSFDNYGDMYVTDRGNNRVQKFVLKSNSCSQSTTTQNTSTSTANTKNSTNAIQPTALAEFVSETDITAVSQPKSTTTTTRTLETNSIAESYFLTSSTSSITATIESTTTTTTIANVSYEKTTIGTTTTKQPAHSFVPHSCPPSDSAQIGVNCNIAADPCTIFKPCKNHGNCYNTALNNYNCSCPVGFNGTHCEFDHRPCKPHTCLDHGICNATSDTTFNCTCHDGWQGLHCESMTNYCWNVTCNNGVCQPLLLNYTCECLSDSYSGRHCEITAKKILIYKIVSKSFSYIAIIAMASVAMFIVIMDILKYCFGIDPVHHERERMRRKKQVKKRKPPVIQRFIYVDAPPSSDIPTSTVEDTTA